MANGIPEPRRLNPSGTLARGPTWAIDEGVGEISIFRRLPDSLGGRDVRSARVSPRPLRFSATTGRFQRGPEVMCGGSVPSDLHAPQ